jgi:hypothetical protein
MPTETKMKNTLRIGALLFALAAGGALAQDKQSAPSAEQELAPVEKLDAQDRQAMTERNKALESQVAGLQTEVKELQDELAKAPRYFDDPTNDPLSP